MCTICALHANAAATSASTTTTTAAAAATARTEYAVYAIRANATAAAAAAGTVPKWSGQRNGKQVLDVHGPLPAHSRRGRKIPEGRAADTERCRKAKRWRGGNRNGNGNGNGNKNRDIIDSSGEQRTKVGKEEDYSFFNLSNLSLPNEMVYILNLGLKHIPVTQHSTEEMRQGMTVAVDTFIRRLPLGMYFIGEEETPKNTAIPRIEDSEWMPTCDTIWRRQVEGLRVELEDRVNRLPYKDIGTRLERDQQCLTITNDWLAKNECTVKPSDKNLGPCVLTNVMYVHLCQLHLQDTQTYQRIGEVSIESKRHIECANNEVLVTILKKYKCYNMESNCNGGDRVPPKLTKLASSLLQLQDSHKVRMAVLHVLPKLHKLDVNNPDYSQLTGRPIVSNINSCGYHTGKYLHNRLFPLVETITTITPSSEVVLRELKELRVNEDDVVMCADVKSLHPSIPIDFGVGMVQRFLQEQRDGPPVDWALLMDLLRWTLESNYFEFNGSIYHQRKGTAMGIPQAPAYANIVLHMMERGIPLIAECRYFRRYLDDDFGICPSAVIAQGIVDHFNSIQPSIQLDAVTIGRSGVFLDLRVSLEGQGVVTQLYQKPMNRYLYLKPSSQHQRSIFANFIRAEVRRCRKYCSKEEDFRRTREQFLERLRARGYNDQQLQMAYIDDPLVLDNHTANQQQLHQLLPKKPRLTGPLMCLPPYARQLTCQVNTQNSMCTIPDYITCSQRYGMAYGHNSNNGAKVTYTNNPNIGSIITRSKFTAAGMK